MKYQFLTGSYETERLKVLGVWSMFEGGLMQNQAPVVYAYPDLDALLEGERAGGRKADLPGPGEKPSTERPDG